VIHVGIVRDNEPHTITKLTDGTVVEKVSGKLILSFTNTGPAGGGTGGKSVVQDVSGSTTTISRPDGHARFERTGDNWLGSGPVVKRIPVNLAWSSPLGAR
jgi:hypothetical protein